MRDLRVIFTVLFIALGIAYSNASFAQNQHVIDSLESRVDSALQQEKSSSYFIWLNYFHLFDEYELIGDEIKAELSFKSSLKFAPHDSFKFKSYYRRAVYFSENHKTDKSMELCASMIKEFPNYSTALSSAYMFMAIAHEHKRDPQNAILYYDKSLKEAIKMNDSNHYIMVKMNLGNTLFDSGNKDSAMTVYKEGLSFYLSRSNGRNKMHALNIMNNIGSGYMGINSDSAFKYLKEVKRLSKNIDDPWLTSLTSLNLGIEYYTVGQPKNASVELRSALKDLNILGEIYYHYEIYRLLAAIEASNQNWNTSMILMDSSKYFSDKVQNEERNQAFAEAKTKFGLEEKEIQNKLLLAERTESNKLIRWQWISVVLVLLILIVVIAFTVRLLNQTKTISVLNKDLAHKNEKLDYILQDKDNIMGILFHDIRSPMAALKTVSDFLDMDANSISDAETKELLREMNNVSTQGLRLVDDIWSIYELESKNLEVNLRTLELEGILEEIRLEFEPAALAKEFSLTISSFPVKIQSHENLLISMIRNLVSNAFKFSPAGSLVSIILEEAPNNVTLKIQDSGPGFSVDDRKLMFKKFQKLSAQPLHGEKSSGLGLYIVRLIGEKINVEVTLNREYVSGAEFIIKIPKA